jgi:hypothetical protein
MRPQVTKELWALGHLKHRRGAIRGENVTVTTASSDRVHKHALS